MKYQIILKTEARKELRKLHNPDYGLIIKTLQAISEYPYSGDAKHLVDVPLWRRRTGNYRVVYSILDEQHIVYIVRIVHRSEKTYRGL